MLVKNEKGPLTLQSHADHSENVFIQSISRNEKFIPVGIDSFSGNVRDFRSYLKAMKRLIKAGVIA